MHSLNHLREEFLQLFKHLQMSGRLRKFNSHRQSRLTPEGLIAPHQEFISLLGWNTDEVEMYQLSLSREQDDGGTHPLVEYLLTYYRHRTPQTN